MNDLNDLHDYGQTQGHHGGGILGLVIGFLIGSRISRGNGPPNYNRAGWFFVIAIVLFIGAILLFF